MSSFEPEYPIDAELWIQTWVGVLKQPCRVIHATPKKFRIESDREILLAGRRRTLSPGATALVPRQSVLLTTATTGEI